jgi:hypothetical protein
MMAAPSAIERVPFSTKLTINDCKRICCEGGSGASCFREAASVAQLSHCLSSRAMGRR